MTRPWKAALLAALAIAALALIYALRAVFLPLLVALLLAYILNPLVTALERRNVPRPLSIAAVYALLAGGTALALLWAVPRAVAEGREFLDVTFTSKDARIHRLLPYLERWFGWENWEQVLEEVRRRIQGHEAELARAGGSILGAVVSFAAGSLRGFLSVVSFVVLVPVYLFFALWRMNEGWERFSRALPEPYRERTLATLGRIHRANAAFFRGQITICAIEGLIVFAGLALIGVKFALLFGALYAVLALVPFVGVTVGFAATSLFVVVDTGGFGRDFFLVTGLFVAIQVLEGAVLQPLILGKETGLHPIAVILALFVFGELFGFLGMLLAIPLASTAKILFEDYVWPAFREVAQTRAVSPSGSPAPPATPATSPPGAPRKD
ncbi:MAG: AI-2E family transporter [Planctomycetota bacterium]